MDQSEFIRFVNKTARSKGAVGRGAIVPRVVDTFLQANPGLRILDFGSGKDPIHAEWLRGKGHEVNAYDIGDNFVVGVHKDLFEPPWAHHVVYASNVLNVVPNRDWLVRTMNMIYWATWHAFICNYPPEPRHCPLTTGEMEKFLQQYFETVEMIHGTPDNPVWLCIGRREA